VLLSFFGAGLLLAFTPCVLPMVPILSGIIAGSGENVTTRRSFMLSLELCARHGFHVYGRRHRGPARSGKASTASHLQSAVDRRGFQSVIRGPGGVDARTVHDRDAGLHPDAAQQYQ
jgi:hypothetical protein